MRQNICKLWTTLIIWLSVIGAFAQDHKPQPFSADYTLTSPAGEQMMVGKIYMAWPKFRVDANDVQHGSIVIAIIDHLAQTAIALSPQHHTYTEIILDQQNEAMKSASPIGPDFDATMPCAGHDSWSCKKLGSEAFAGRQCDVWEIVTDVKWPIPVGTLTAWIDPKLNFPIKTKTSDGYIMEYTNIQEGQPAPNLFQVPSGYTKSAVRSKSTSPSLTTPNNM
jgi:hypothetical protein